MFVVRIEQWLACGAHVPKGVGLNGTSNIKTTKKYLIFDKS
jgi:hypothetical protein